MKLAFYKAKGKFVNRAIRFFTRSPYSHVEAVFGDGLCFSADGWQTKADRFKVIDIRDGKWDLVDVPWNEFLCRRWAEHRVAQGTRYDYKGVIRFIPVIGWFFSQDANKDFCSESMVEMAHAAGELLDVRAWRTDPGELFTIVTTGRHES